MNLAYSVKVEHRVTRDWLIAFVAYHIATDDKLPLKSAPFWKRVKEDLTTCGEEMFWHWDDHAGPDQTATIKQEATDFIDTLFP